MGKGRLEAFSDGVLAIIITIMVLELEVPDHSELSALRLLVPTVLGYVLSFIYLGIYWNNHHHLLQATRHIDGRVLWANLHLLFWVSLIPFVTGWMGRNSFATLPVAFYGAVLMLSAIAYLILARALIACQGKNSALAKALGRAWKGKISVLIYVVAIPLYSINRWLACFLYVSVAIMWLIPDRRIERTLNS